MDDRVRPTIYIKWVRSGIGFDRSQGVVVRSLGLRRLNQIVERPDTPQVRGSVAKVAHLVEIVSGVPEPMWGGSSPANSIKEAESQPMTVSESVSPPEESPSFPNEESEKHKE